VWPKKGAGNRPESNYLRDEGGDSAKTFVHPTFANVANIAVQNVRRPCSRNVSITAGSQSFEELAPNCNHVKGENKLCI